MKKFFLVAIIILSSVNIMAQNKTKQIEISFETSITCDHCVNTIMSSLPLEKGIKNVKCNLKTKEVTVIYKPKKTNPDKIKRSLEKLGYSAKVKQRHSKKSK